MTASRARLGGAIAILSIALATRLLYVLLAGANSVALSADAMGYHDIALNLVTRHEFTTATDPPHRLDVPYAARAPLTPFFLAVIYWITSPSWTVAQVALSFVGAISSVLVGLLGHRLFGPATGLLAGLLAAFYPFFIFLSSVPLTENLSIPLWVGLALLLLKLGVGGGWRDAVMTGAVLGLAALNKPIILGFIPFLALWLLLHFRREMRKAFTMFGIILAVSAAIIAPWTFRNFQLFNMVVPITTIGGWTLYTANGPPAEYSISLLEKGAQGWYAPPWEYPPLGGRSHVEADREAGRLALEFIRTHPRIFLDQARRKVRIFWGAYPYLIHKLSWGVVAVLSVIGMGMTWRCWRRLMPIYLLIFQTALIPVFFTSMPRYRAPIEPLLTIFAVVPLVALSRFALSKMASTRSS